MKMLFSNGTQLPFERMTNIFLKMADKLEDAEIYYQAGKGAYNIEVSESRRNKNKIDVFDFCSEDKYETLLKQSDIVVTHAGMGNIINLLAMQVDFVMLPRLIKYKEHRNNHQHDSAVSINKKFNIPFFLDEKDLVAYLLNFDFSQKSDAGSNRSNKIKSSRDFFSKNIMALLG